jgi:hypothetical protein
MILKYVATMIACYLNVHQPLHLQQNADFSLKRTANVDSKDACASCPWQYFVEAFMLDDTDALAAGNASAGANASQDSAHPATIRARPPTRGAAGETP